MRHAPFLASIVAAVLSVVVSFGSVLAQESTPAPIAPEAGVTVETLLDTVVVGLPEGRARIALDRWRFRPSARPVTMPALGGPAIVAVEAGTIAVSEEGAVRQLAAAEHVILSGENPASFQVGDAEEAIAAAIYIVPSGFTMEGWDSDPLAHFFEYPIDATADELSGGAGRVLVERITLSPGSALPPQEASALVWWGITEGRVGIMLEGERLPFRWKSGEEREFAGGQSFPFIAAGTRMTFRNTEDRPVVLYRLTLTPEAASGAGETTATPVG